MQTFQLDFVTPSEAERCGAFELREQVFSHAEQFTAEDVSRNCFHLVAREDTKTLGYGKLVVDGAFARVKHVCVSPDAQRSGLGSRILLRLLDRAREEHTTTVWLLARFTALGFYHKFGFVEVGPVVRSEDSAAPHRRMELRFKL